MIKSSLDNLARPCIKKVTKICSGKPGGGAHLQLQYLRNRGSWISVSSRPQSEFQESQSSVIQQKPCLENQNLFSG